MQNKKNQKREAKKALKKYLTAYSSEIEEKTNIDFLNTNKSIDNVIESSGYIHEELQRIIKNLK